MYQNVEKYDIHLNKRGSGGLKGKQKLVYANTGRVEDSDPGIFFGSDPDTGDFSSDPDIIVGTGYDFLFDMFSVFVISHFFRRSGPFKLIQYRLKILFLTSPHVYLIE